MAGRLTKFSVLFPRVWSGPRSRHYSSLSITPSEVEADEKVTISAVVTNAGDSFSSTFN